MVRPTLGAMSSSVIVATRRSVRVAVTPLPSAEQSAELALESTAGNARRSSDKFAIDGADVVFDVVSSPEHLREWWPDEAEFPAVPGGAGRIGFGVSSQGGTWVQFAVVDAVPPRLFSFRELRPQFFDGGAERHGLRLEDLVDQAERRLAMLRGALGVGLLEQAESLVGAELTRYGLPSAPDGLTALADVLFTQVRRAIDDGDLGYAAFTAVR